MLLQQMTDIMTKSETIEPVKDDKERFGDPLKIIKEKVLEEAYQVLIYIKHYVKQVNT